MEWEREGYPLCGKGSTEPATGQVSPKTQVEGSRATNPPSAPAAAPDAQTPKNDDEGLRLSALDAAEIAEAGKRGIDAMVFRACALRLEHLLRENAGLRELFQESQRRRVEHEDTIGDLRRQLAEAQTYADPLLFQQFITEKQRAETAEAALAAFKQEYADMKLALAAERAAKEAAQNSDEHNFNRWQQAERERDAAADLAREECAKICEWRSAFWGSVKNYSNEAAALDCSRAIRSTITDPAAVKRTTEDAARFVYYCKVLYDYSLQADWPDSFRDAETIDQLRAAIDAARNGEEG